MRTIFLIAVNFVREQRWPILVLLLWVLLLAFLGLVTDVHRQREDLLFIFKQVAVYVVVFSVFFGGSAIHNERKSRRILAVLSKAVGRQQYLSGLVGGITIACTWHHRKLDFGRGGIFRAASLVSHALFGCGIDVGGNHSSYVLYVSQSVLRRWRHGHGVGLTGLGCSRGSWVGIYHPGLFA